MPILGKVQEIRDIIRDKYGVEVDVKIAAHSVGNESLTKEKANQISFDIAQELSPDCLDEYINTAINGTYWVSLVTSKFEFAAFYDGPKNNPWDFQGAEKDAS
ncbi:MAG: hypothetical protein FH756_01710 [Firmicutes bacterium]|nr:hypothetical protein [Bacillota bacterium]